MLLLSLLLLLLSLIWGNITFEGFAFRFRFFFSSFSPFSLIVFLLLGSSEVGIYKKKVKYHYICEWAMLETILGFFPSFS